jgi:putative membrane protein
MRYLRWILKLALFVLVLGFALKNTDTVTVRYYLGGEWQSPLILVLLLAFCAGAAVGLAAGLAYAFRQRREIAALRRRLRVDDVNRGDAEAQRTLRNGFQA